MLFVTGYAEEFETAGDKGETGLAVMGKPFDLCTLGTQIDRLLGLGETRDVAAFNEKSST